MVDTGAGSDGVIIACCEISETEVSAVGEGMEPSAGMTPARTRRGTDMKHMAVVGKRVCVVPHNGNRNTNRKAQQQENRRKKHGQHLQLQIADQPGMWVMQAPRVNHAKPA